MKYQPCEKVLLRAPLRPIERFLELTDPTTLDLGERLAITIASQSISNALERADHDGKVDKRLQGRILRYLIRMATRSTPFGMFAGVALADLSEMTTVALADSRSYTRSRCDTVGVFSLVWALESLPEIMDELLVVVSSAASAHSNRLRLIGVDRAPSPGVDHCVDVRLTEPVRCVLRLASSPIRFRDISAAVLASTPGATKEKVERLLRELWRNGFLVTDLRPPLTGRDPLAYVIERLGTIPAAASVRASLAEFHQQMAEWDHSTRMRDLTSYQKLIGDAQRLTGGESKSLLQVDTALQLSSRSITSSVGFEAVKAAELLLRLTMRPHGPPYLTAYRHDFLARYGAERAVPLLELLDSEMGLGTPHFEIAADQGIRSREEKLVELATNALYSRAKSIELDEATLSVLQTYAYSPNTAPFSLDIYLQIAAKSKTDLDRGDFLVVVGPNIGSNGAGRNLGRFFDLLPDAGAVCQEIAHLEELRAPKRLFAELVYRPPSLDVANVVICPAVRRFEVGLTVTAHESDAKTIPLNEVYVCCDLDRLSLRWFHEGIDNGEMSIVSGHMLNSSGSPSVCRFLDDVAHDGRAMLSWFDWAGAAKFPYLPRVTVGRVVLRLAQWRKSRVSFENEISTLGANQFKQRFMNWTREWDLPRYVYVNNENNMADNRLLLDLRSDSHSDLACELLRDLGPEDALVFQEALPGPDDAWLSGVDGRYLSELVVSMIRKDEEPTSSEWRVGTRHGVVRSVDRIYPPGTEWLTMQIYTRQADEDDILSQQLRLIAREAQSTCQVDKWMFLRYADPESHIRFRVHGEAQAIRRVAMPKLSEWASDLVRTSVFNRFSFSTYEREIERYGGLEGMEVAEVIYGADSVAVVNLLHLLQVGKISLDKIELAVVTVDDLIASFGIPLDHRLAWCETLSVSRHRVSQEYRNRKVRLRTLLNVTEADSQGPLYEVLRKRRPSFMEGRRQLDSLIRQGMLERDIQDLLKSYVHLHCNRLLGRDREAEVRVLGLLLRTYKSLVRHPATSD